jgi:hypothetical protein
MALQTGSQRSRVNPLIALDDFRFGKRVAFKEGIKFLPIEALPLATPIQPLIP